MDKVKVHFGLAFCSIGRLCILHGAAAMKINTTPDTKPKTRFQKHSRSVTQPSVLLLNFNQCCLTFFFGHFCAFILDSRVMQQRSSFGLEPGMLWFLDGVLTSKPRGRPCCLTSVAKYTLYLIDTRNKVGDVDSGTYSAFFHIKKT